MCGIKNTSFSPADPKHEIIMSKEMSKHIGWQLNQNLNQNISNIASLTNIIHNILSIQFRQDITSILMIGRREK